MTNVNVPPWLPNYEPRVRGIVARRIAERGEAVVYRIYDGTTDELLYVGCTKNPRLRPLQHHYRRYRRDEVRYEFDEPQPMFAALLAERRQIIELRPRDNARL